MMKLEGIATFVAVAEAGSISEAARRLRLSKSIVSERLAELERQIGAVLLHRTTRSLALTEDGAAFLDRAARITREVEDAAADMAERRGLLVGPLRISAPVTFGRMHLGPALFPFLKAHPDIELFLDLDDRRVDVASDGYDAVIRHGLIADSRLITWRLASSQRVLVASPAYIERYGTPDSIESLDQHKGIFYANRGVADWSFPTNGTATTVRGRIGLRVNNGDTMRDAAIAGIGIAMLPSFVAGEAIKAGQLQVIDIGVAAVAEHIYIAHPEGRTPSAKLRALADHLRKAFGSPAYWDC
ncbi:transcriptional regulator, LysR family [Phyllobacterium sp. YR620]|uniref:LysR family transcriptional regulator n=1 Tax=Phyllobacterium sp. YR620 TaxID=1881066 RepID=UPI000891D4E0|nr:LysR family transcriptional regulator [Phyllobacterium sp. YR620]SDP58105.1 transcriptional regulator, LysR family [Phyllobacterium sp. YR620]